jgi:two-component system LytT family response regulator
MKIRTLIVDDEPLARKRIKRLLIEEPDIEIIGECASGREAIERIQDTSPDLLFLDIQMPEIGGFEVLEALGGGKMPLIIFVTAYDQHALQAFEVHALDYLLKPFRQERFKAAVEHALTQLRESGAPESESYAGLAELIGKLQTGQNHLSRFMVKSSNRVVVVKASEVDWMESASNYVVLHAGEQTHIVRQTIQSLEERLCPKTFLRISRSVIVNLERVQELQPMAKGEYVVLLANGQKLTMTRGIRDFQKVLESR